MNQKQPIRRQPVLNCFYTPCTGPVVAYFRYDERLPSWDDDFMYVGACVVHKVEMELEMFGGVHKPEAPVYISVSEEEVKAAMVMEK